MPMTQQQISDLTSAHDAAVADPTAENIAAYYSILEEAGFEYGTLAKGVMLDNTLAGVFANNFVFSSSSV